MALMLISYDLINPEKDYPDLLAYLRKISAKRVLYSEWMIQINSTTRDLLDAVRAQGKMDSNDKLLVIQVSDWSSYNVMTPINDI